MKKIAITVISCLLLSLPYYASAQKDKDESTAQEVKSGIKKGYKGAKKGVKKGAHEVAEQASELKSDITDKEVDHKMGPDGQDIFLSDDGRYYYVDGKGHHVYLKSSELKDRKPEKDDD